MLIQVTEPSQTGEARRRALEFAEDLQMDATRCGQVALATTEIATNLVKHAGSGHVLVQRVQRDGESGVRLTGVDHGPGIQEVGRALLDGHSTSGSMGTGLGAIQRVADSFDIYSVPGSGTVIVADFWKRIRGHEIPRTAVEIGVVSEPIRGEDVCGDGWGVRACGETVFLMVVDGLGHGLFASDAARVAERIFFASREGSPIQILNDTHLALKQTRGAAEGLAKIDAARGLVSFAGIGNTSASVLAAGASRSMASHNGTLGQNVERVQEFTAPWTAESILVMHTDGLATRWDLNKYPGIWGKPASVIAAVLHRDFCRNRDDVTVLVAKASPETQGTGKR
jgi:anti-sigma regulatory factor (Ser/Thr protein kinase)